MPEPGEGTPPQNPPVADPAGENSVIRSMRAQLEAANKRADEHAAAAKKLQDDLTAKERAELAEVDRLKAELKDREDLVAERDRLKAENGRFVSAYEASYNAKLAAIPEDKRETVAALSASGTWADRVDALEKAATLLGAPAAGRGGTVTQPGANGGGAGSGGVEKPGKYDGMAPSDWGKIGFTEAIEGSRALNKRE